MPILKKTNRQIDIELFYSEYLQLDFVYHINIRIRHLLTHKSATRKKKFHKKNCIHYLLNVILNFKAGVVIYSIIFIPISDDIKMKKYKKKYINWFRNHTVKKL